MGIYGLAEWRSKRMISLDSLSRVGYTFNSVCLEQTAFITDNNVIELMKYVLI